MNSCKHEWSDILYPLVVTSDTELERIWTERELCLLCSMKRITVMRGDKIFTNENKSFYLDNIEVVSEHIE